MNRSVAIFLSGLAIIALAAALFARGLTEPDALALRGALAGILAGAVSIAASFFPLRRRLGASNLRFLRAFFAGLLIRLLVLALAALAVRQLTDWGLHEMLIAVGLSYPLYMMLEGWVLARELPKRREHESDGEVGDRNRAKE